MGQIEEAILATFKRILDEILCIKEHWAKYVSTLEEKELIRILIHVFDTNEGFNLYMDLISTISPESFKEVIRQKLQERFQMPIDIEETTIGDRTAFVVVPHPIKIPNNLDTL